MSVVDNAIYVDGRRKLAPPSLDTAFERGDVADLGDEHRGQDRPDPRDLLDGLVAGIGAQPAGATSRAKASISKSSAAITLSSESTRDRDSTVSRVAASSRRPSTPNRSLIGTGTPEPVPDPSDTGQGRSGGPGNRGPRSATQTRSGEC